MNPDDDAGGGVDVSPPPGSPLDGVGVGAAAAAAAAAAAFAWAARICAPSDALCDASACDSCTNSSSFTLIDDSVALFESRAVASCCCDEMSCAVTECCA